MLTVVLHVFYADVFVRLKEIESVQAGFERQLQTIQTWLGALTANQCAPDRLPNTAAKSLVTGSSILSTVPATDTVREEVAPQSPTHSSESISTPGTEKIPAQTATPVTEAISSTVTEDMYRGTAAAISTPVTGVVSKTITASEFEAISAPVTTAYGSNSAEHTALQG